ncbi:uncharacterized protein LAESUDRAFT_763112 [Laetiporus sulphureus 93-53]|uniref:Uncharacterized protein n=1 Tax=Laetiporus sulphureus 93-53 TaxID=1314785 RepID=A0A165C443_9APHY|nr:uncharacterized protein LAESUDRAFT_763112 [Laetiporus sulphureus 93-53]KZT02170.1 hypothetical protein LAESUDRAFT_763112 [Laetiporus sulphureus 93-53]
MERAYIGPPSLSAASAEPPAAPNTEPQAIHRAGLHDLSISTLDAYHLVSQCGIQHGAQPPPAFLKFVRITVAVIVILGYGTDLLATRRATYFPLVVATCIVAIIASTLCYVLSRCRTGYLNTDSTISVLMLFTISTGIVAMLYSLMAMPAALTDAFEMITNFLVTHPDHCFRGAMGELDATYGAVFIGAFVSAVLFGVTNLQAFIYFQRYSSDGVWSKIAVCWLWLLDAVHLIFVSLYGRSKCNSEFAQAIVVISVHSLYTARAIDAIYPSMLLVRATGLVSMADSHLSAFLKFLRVAVTVIVILGYGMCSSSISR